MDKKKQIRPKKLIYLQTVSIPPYTLQDFKSGKATEVTVDWREPKENADKIIYYRGDDGNKYRLERIMPTTDEELADMMLLDAATVGLIRDRKIYKIREEPKVFTDPNLEIYVKKIVRAKDNVKIVKDDKDFLLRIVKIGKLK